MNNLGLRKVDMSRIRNARNLRCHWRKTFGICGTNCNLCHNLHSTMGMLVLNLRSHMNDIVHWPCQITTKIMLQMSVGNCVVAVWNAGKT